MGRGPSNDVNGIWGVSGLSAAMEIDKASLRALCGTATYKDLPATQQWQKHGFQSEKAAKQQCGPDTTAKMQNEGMRAK